MHEERRIYEFLNERTTIEHIFKALSEGRARRDQEQSLGILRRFGVNLGLLISCS